MSRGRALWLAAFFAAGLIAACTSYGVGEQNQKVADAVVASVTVKELSRHDQCGQLKDEPDVQVFQAQAELDRALESLPSGVNPDIDFDSEWVAIVWQGRRPTLGYGVSLVSEQVNIDQGVAWIVVRWREPDAGAMVGQALTSPCVLFAVEHQVVVERVEVEDTQGQPVGNWDLDADR